MAALLDSILAASAFSGKAGSGLRNRDTRFMIRKMSFASTTGNSTTDLSTDPRMHRLQAVSPYASARGIPRLAALNKPHFCVKNRAVPKAPGRTKLGSTAKVPAGADDPHP